MFRYYNANPLDKSVNDCTVRAISLASGLSWDETYLILCNFARKRGVMPDEVEHIDTFLKKFYTQVYCCRRQSNLTVGDFVERNPAGVFLITMQGHITCCVDGCIYDTFDPKDRYIWEAYKVDKKGL